MPELRPTALPKGTSAPSPLAAADALKTVVDACRDYLQIREENKTKRREIAAHERVALARISAQQDLLMSYLDRSFDERSQNFRRLFEALGASLRAGDGNAVSQALGAIVQLAQRGPLADLADLASVTRSLNDPDHEWSV